MTPQRFGIERLAPLLLLLLAVPAHAATRVHPVDTFVTSHSPIEVADLRDVEGLVRLVLAAATAATH